MNYRTITLLLCLLTLFLGSACEEDAREIREIVFDKRGRRKVGLTPELTLKLLIQLDETYAKLNYQKSRADISALIEVSKLSDKKCSKDTSHQLERLLKLHKSSDLNLIPYLQYHRRQQYRICTKIVSQFFESNTLELIAEDRFNVNLLRECVKKPSFGAILDYIEEREGSLRHIVKEEFDEKFDRDVKELCKRVNAKLNVEDHLGIKSFYVPEDLLTMMEAETRNWLRSARICRIYLRNMSLLRDQVYNEHLKNQKRGFLGRLLKKGWTQLSSKI